MIKLSPQTKWIVATALVGVVGFGAGVAVAAQPHMVNALNDLTSARSELNVAEADKAGHRVAAIGLVQQAINQVQAGIDAAGG